MRSAHVDPETGLMSVSSDSGAGAPRNHHTHFFEGASVNRFTQDWVTKGATMDALLEDSLCRLRQRSRQIIGSDGYAQNWVNQTKANVLGDGGFRLKMKAKNKRGGEDKAANAAIETAWGEFCKAENYSVTRNMTEQAFDVLNLVSIITTGGGLARKVRGFDNSFRYALQGIPIDHLDPEYFDAKRRISMSVEANQWGEAQAYHLLRQHPGNRRAFGGAVKGPRDRYSADEMLHVYMSEEFGQSQGKPWLSCALIRLRQLHAYEEAELIAARAHASKLGFFEESFESAGYTGEGETDTGNIIMDGSPGTFDKLPPGVSAKLLEANHPNGNYPDFRKAMLRGVAAGVITNYNLLGQDLEGVNYSSIRSGTLAERDLWKMVQRWYIDSFKKPVFSDWLEWSLLTGAIGNYSITDFDRLNNPDFTGRRWAWVDPDKDSRAEERRLKSRLTSHQRIARQHGEDIDEILQEVKDDEKKAEKLDLDLFLELDEPQTMPQQPLKPEEDEAE